MYEVHVMFNRRQDVLAVTPCKCTAEDLRSSFRSMLSGEYAVTIKYTGRE